MSKSDIVCLPNQPYNQLAPKGYPHHPPLQAHTCCKPEEALVALFYHNRHFEYFRSRHPNTYHRFHSNQDIFLLTILALQVKQQRWGATIARHDKRRRQSVVSGERFQFLHAECPSTKAILIPAQPKCGQIVRSPTLP